MDANFNNIWLRFKNEINLYIIFKMMISSEIISISFNLIMNQFIDINPKKYILLIKNYLEIL